jgi:MtN3 and saliva related transmembrane protein
MGTEIWWDIVGMVAATCTSSGLIPQLVRGIKTRRLDDVSPGLLVLMIVGCTLWFLYGFHKWDMIIMGANAFVVILSATILSLRRHYIKQRVNGNDRGYEKGHR